MSEIQFFEILKKLDKTNNFLRFYRDRIDFSSNIEEMTNILHRTKNNHSDCSMCVLVSHMDYNMFYDFNFNVKHLSCDLKSIKSIDENYLTTYYKKLEKFVYKLTKIIEDYKLQQLVQEIDKI